MKKKRLLLFYLFFPLFLGAQTPATMDLEPSLLSGQFQNVRFFSQGVLRGLELSEVEHHLDEKTDALFHFNQELKDYSGRYTPQKTSASITPQFKKRGEGSLVFQKREPLKLEAKPGSLFYPGTLWDDFTIEFWLYSANLEDGEMIFLWQGGSQILSNLGERGQNRDLFANQELRAQIENRRLVWYFHNFFLSTQGPSGELRLTGRDALIPRQWSYHKLTFDSTTGKLEYAVDFIPEAILPVTEDGSYQSPPLRPFVGESSRPFLEIGSNFIGFMDELRISHTLRDHPSKGHYETQGFWESPIIPLGERGGRLHRLLYSSSAGSGTGYEIQYRVAQSLEKVWDQGQRNVIHRISDQIPWSPLSKGGMWTEEVKGNFLQLKIRLYGNALQDETPRLYDLGLQYFPHKIPPTPSSLQAKALDSSVQLSWQPVFVDGIREYRIYFGQHPDFLDGVNAMGQSSPVVIPPHRREFLLQGLENNSLYYFTIVAVDEGGRSSPSSRLVTARPQGGLE